jgi:uncharacterized membrane protein YvbJ
VNLTNRKELFWNQHKSSVTVMVGEGSHVKGQKDGNIILKEKNSGRNLKISSTYCPDFRKNTLSLQMAGYMVTFDDGKATIKDKKMGEITLICEQGYVGMLYLKREQDVEEGEGDENGKTIKKVKLPKQTWMDINVAHQIWGHKGNALLLKTAVQQHS